MATPHWKTVLIASISALVYAALFILTGSLCCTQILFGIPCPGCGSTRAAIALFQGRFADAFAMHPLIPLSLAILLYALIRGLFYRHKPLHRAEKYAASGAVALYTIVYIVRMIILFPHTQPMTPLKGAIWPALFQWLFDLVSNWVLR